MAAGTYVRVGSTNRIADAELIQELGRFAPGEAFDEQPMPGLDSEAIDFRAASESFAAVRKLARRDLETLRLVTRYQGRKVPTVGGMILFGADRERHFPDAWIQVGRFGGPDKSRIVDRTEIHDACICLLAALYLAESRECLMVGNLKTGYIVVPYGEDLYGELTVRCEKIGREPSEWVRSSCLAGGTS